MKLGTFLVATDFSNGADRALERAAGIASHRGSPLVVLYVAGPAPLPLMPGASESERLMIDEMRRARARAELDRRLSELSARKLETRIQLRDGPVVDTIARAAREVDADFVVTGARGVSGDNVFVIGSVAEGVARRAQTNVLVVRDGAETGLFHRILIATDLSEASKAVVPTAISLAAPDADVELMHVVDWGDHAPPIRGAHGSPAPDFKKLWSAVIAEAEKELDALAAQSRQSALNLHYRVVEGVSAVEIIKHTEQSGADLLVVGKHAAEPPPYARVAERVVRRAPCSVLIARRRPGALHAVD